MILDFLRFFLIIFVPGLVATYISMFITRHDVKNILYTSFIYDMFIYLTMITGLYFFKGIYTMPALITSMNCLSFTRRYTILSIGIGIMLAICWSICWKIFHHCRRKSL